MGDFLKAQALDPHDGTVNGLVQSAREGNRLAGVKDLMSQGIYSKILDKWGVSAGAISNPVINGATS